MPTSANPLPIADYAAVGDGRTVALIGRGGSVDWLCLPNTDSPAVFGRLLDLDRGGFFALGPVGGSEASRRYLPGTNVLETTQTTATGTIRVTDALTLPGPGLAPQRELVRLVEGVDGEVEIGWQLEPRFGYGLAPTRLESRPHALVASSGADALALLVPDRDEAARGGAAAGLFTMRAGDREVVVLTAAHGEPLVLPSAAEAVARLEATARSWRRWAETRTYDGPWRDEVVRSALALKLLVFAPSGAIAAAPTTSLPERIGGDRNYDYRYCWIRDSAFTMSAFLELGCAPEARAFLSWLMHASQLTRPELRVLYTLHGGEEEHERPLPLAGYRDSQPVRVGNAASGQLQLDAYGDLLDAAWVYDTRAERLDREIGKRLAGVADHVCSIWREQDAGIWEIRERVAHFTEGKMKCAIALERACALARRGSVPAAHVESWERQAAEIRLFVEEECWSDELGSYVRAAGSRELDASVLLAGQNRYSEEGDERLSATIDAVRARLGDGPLLYRADDLREQEGAFVACSFWLVTALAHVGRVEEAAETMEAMLAHANDVGLLAEEIDPGSGEFLGNFPQGLSHLALINAAAALADATTA